MSALPHHVAIVMDGNGRWAEQRGEPRLNGHRAGVQALVGAIQAFAQRGVRVLTVYAFSTENWGRPEPEVSGLMGLVPTAMKAHLDRLNRNGIRVRMVGDGSGLSASVREAFQHMEALTACNERLTLNVAFNYGGRWDVVQACRQALAQGWDPDSLTEERLGQCLALGDTPDPDLIIRTGGECRLSNFLLWQAAYAELHFTDRLWPDFGETDVQEALDFFAGRQRRFGGLQAAV